MFGKVVETPQTEKTPFTQESLWSCKSLLLLDYNKLQRSYNLFACNGILFNHESPLRGETL